jgi:hypothetical protein
MDFLCAVPIDLLTFVVDGPTFRLLPTAVRYHRQPPAQTITGFYPIDKVRGTATSVGRSTRCSLCVPIGDSRTFLLAPVSFPFDLQGTISRGCRCHKAALGSALAARTNESARLHLLMELSAPKPGRCRLTPN